MNILVLRYLRYLLSGVFLGVFALEVSTLPPKYYFGIVGATFIMAPAAYAYLIISTQTKTRLICLFIATFAIGIALNLDYNFFYRPYVGVTSVDISVSLLSLFTVFCFFAYDARLSYRGSSVSRRTVRSFALCWIYGRRLPEYGFRRISRPLSPGNFPVAGFALPAVCDHEPAG